MKNVYEKNIVRNLLFDAILPRINPMADKMALTENRDITTIELV